MTNLTRRIIYFEKSGKVNTNETLRLAKKRAEALKIRNVVIASSSGETGVKASEVFRNFNLVVVSSVVGLYMPNVSALKPANKAIIDRNGGKTIIATHAFGGLGRAVRLKFGSMQIDEVIAHVLRIAGQGMKVACEIACMATDAGYFRTDEEAVAIGGSGNGVDTAIVVQPSNTHNFFDMRIKEIICKPR